MHLNVLNLTIDRHSPELQRSYIRQPTLILRNMVGAAGFEPALFAVGQYRRGHAIAYTPENGAGRRGRTSVRCLQDSRPAFERCRHGTGGRIQTSVNLAP